MSDVRRGSSPREDWEVAITQLDGRVTGLESTLTEIVGQLRNLGTKIEDRAKIQWPALAFALSFITVVGGLVYWPVVTTQNRFEGAITKMSETAVSKDDFLLVTTASKERRDDAQRQNEARFARIEKDLDTAQASIVPRGEHEEKWTGQRQKDGDIQRQIDELRTDFHGLYSARDVLTTLERKVDQLETKVSAAQK